MFLSFRIWAITMAGAPPSTCPRGLTMKVRSTLKPAMPSSWSSACSSMAGLPAKGRDQDQKQVPSKG